ncbi:restriction endonuclease [Actinoplanes sp. LDG1-06]|uniref:Restriction endonuclease n=1 Tax=Paractinoplanes ovalisporus TaxID=2810368 RepID=A0ABS2ABF9_9ACTN|nr:restriction endonuclease [Actinoplanes ovalisporus]MBM2617155.1 restriction endonuclease [Actinoplanes ovalisporus]
MTQTGVPAYNDLLWPTLSAVRTLGGSGSNDEIADSVIKEQGFTEEQQELLHHDGPTTELEYRLAWARTYLKGMGLLVNSTRSVWSLTEDGRTVQKAEISDRHRKYVAEYRLKRLAKKQQSIAEVPDQQLADEEATASGDAEAEASDDLPDWREQLLDALMGMAPDGFERLAQRLLREAGFISATVTGRTGDGGIDGLGVYRMSLVSFPVFFQCKRYKGSVGSAAVRDFRGAMAGRGDKGLLITTGTFTREAKAEATRDGAPPVDLIDGHRLCDLLKEYDLGVTTTIRQVEDVAVDAEFFTEV